MSRLFLAVPCAKANPDIMGGQVTAARGLLDYLEAQEVEHAVVDTAAFSTATSAVGRLWRKLRTFLTILSFALVGRFHSALFFKSTLPGLFERSLPALFFRLRGVKVGLFFRNSDLLSLEKDSLSERLVRWLLRPYSVFFVQGMAWKERLVAMGFPPEKVVLIPNWLPPGFEVAEAPKSDPSGRPVRFVFTGRIVREKGVVEIIHALASNDLNGRCECVLAGDGPDLEYCRQLVADRGIKGVEFTGNLSARAVRDLLVSCDVFVLPTYHPEGFPNSLLEAMALGLPVISTDVGAIAESVTDGVNGTLVQPKSAVDLCNAMAKYVKSPTLVAGQSIGALGAVTARHDRSRNCQLLLNTLL